MVERLACSLQTSWMTGRPTDPPSVLHADFDMDTAYAVEAELRRLRAGEGHGVVGRKVGYANKAMWRVLKLDRLVWASMYDDTVHDAASLPALSLKGFFGPRIEPEIVFKLKTAPVAALDAAGALACVEWMALGFEIIDCPFPGWQFKPADFVAAYGLHRALVIGPPGPPGTPDQLAAFKVRLSRNGEFVEEGAGKNSLRSPALCLSELAGAALRQFPSFPLESGELISTGTLTGVQSAAAGEIWHAEAEGLPAAPVTLAFS
jgi:2-oxo-3-hexenedioate decarboxylase